MSRVRSWIYTIDLMFHPRRRRALMGWDRCNAAFYHLQDHWTHFVGAGALADIQAQKILTDCMEKLLAEAYR